MTYTEVLPTLKTLNHKDKIRVLQFLENEVAKEELYFEERKTYEIYSPYESYEAAAQLRKLLEETEKVDA